MATYDLTSTTPTKIKTGDILNCPYSGSAKQITLPKGQYKLECWGAQGGTYSSYKGGPGGYSVGKIILTKKETLFFYVGGAGTTSTAAGFNGGGTGISSGRGGGGASDIRIGQDSLYARVIVAGGGGGAGVTGAYANPAGCGGGLYGGDGYHNNTTGTYTTGQNRNGGSASQTAGGKSWQTRSSSTGTFGKGGNASGYSCGGGGGGWYGGGGAYDNDSDSDGRWGGGGSGYVYTSSTASNYPSGCLLNSSYYLTNAQTIAGNTSFTSPTGTNETGHTGNGYIRITVIKAGSGNTLVKTTSNTWKKQKQMFVNTGISTTIPSGLVELEYIKPNSTQYINTQFIPTGNTRVIFTFEPTVADSQALYTGGRTADSGTDAKTFSAFYISKAIRRDYYGTSKTTTTTYDINTKITVDANKNTTLINGSSALTDFILKTSKTSIMPIILFIAAKQTSSTSAIQTSGSGAQYKFYSCKIYDNGTLVRDFVPAKRISDDKCGLWDKVNLKFYTDENGGNFTAGTEKTTIAAVGTPIEYIESTGTQYIDTGLSAPTGMRVQCDVEFTSLRSGLNLLFGSHDASDPYYRNYLAASSNGYWEIGAYGYGTFGSVTTGRKYNIDVCTISGSLSAKIDGTAYAIGNIAPTTKRSDLNVYLFALNYAGGLMWSSMKLYSAKIYLDAAGSSPVRDFIPCKNASGVIGMWDKVNKVFYKNAGTGTFTAGPTVTLTGWHKIKGMWTKTAADTWSQAL